MRRESTQEMGAAWYGASVPEKNKDDFSMEGGMSRCGKSEPQWQEGMATCSGILAQVVKTE